MKRFMIVISAVLLLLCGGCREVNISGTASSFPSDIKSEALQTAYENAQNLHKENPEKYRDLSELQAEATEITELGGQYYQAFTKPTDKYPQGLIYIYISKEEYQSRVNEAVFWEFNWIAIGTRENCSFENVGRFNE